MAKITFTGIEEYMAALQKLGESTEGIAKKALYEGANIVADEMRAGIDALPTDESWGTQKNPAKGIREKQKQGLQEGFGISLDITMLKVKNIHLVSLIK